jgi:hypothetical protein
MASVSYSAQMPLERTGNPQAGMDGRRQSSLPPYRIQVESFAQVVFLYMLSEHLSERMLKTGRFQATVSGNTV